MQRTLEHSYPQIYLVDRGGPDHPSSHPNLVPTWPVLPPPAQRRRGAGQGCVATLVIVLLLLVLVALGFGAYQLLRLQEELLLMKQGPASRTAPVVQKQVGLPPPPAEEKKETKMLAHLTVLNVTSGSHTLQWEPIRGPAFTSGLEYWDGALVINETGPYFVYSQVAFRGHVCPTRGSVLTHTVFRQRGNPTPIVLLQGHQRGFCTQSGPWTCTSYLGGVVELRRLDRLYVSVSDPSAVMMDHFSTYFGLYKV
ncbi:tumor necrosis factor ligand superfamily member 6 [Amia ocellicauda]|uniref:tumor necrosis factor ligand superfamily member 6 n=1 Tax=Amia ocellicauda TaxID=2972642 RepID=UPI003464A721|nr:TNFL6 factor [Amia calva]